MDKASRAAEFVSRYALAKRELRRRAVADWLLTADAVLHAPAFGQRRVVSRTLTIESRDREQRSRTGYIWNLAMLVANFPVGDSTAHLRKRMCFGPRSISS